MPHKLELINVMDTEKTPFNIAVIWSAMNLYFKLSDIFYFLNVKEWTVFTSMYVSDLKYYSDFQFTHKKMDVATLFIPINSLYMLLRLLECGKSCNVVKHRDLLIFVQFVEERWKKIFNGSLNVVLKEKECPLDLSSSSQNTSLLREMLTKNADYITSKNETV